MEQEAMRPAVTIKMLQYFIGDGISAKVGKTKE